MYVDRKNQRKLKDVKQAGILLFLMKLVLSALKPALTAFATKKIADIVTNGASENRAANKRALR